MTDNHRNHGRDYFYYALGLGAIMLHALVIYQNALNIPKWDDYTNILQFMDTWIEADNISDKFKAFTSHINEHILLVNHVIVLCQYYLTGTINFAWLMAIGNLFYIGSALVLWCFFQSNAERAWIFSVIMLVCVSFHAYDSLLWAMTAISNQAVIFFSLLAIYCASKSRHILMMIFSTLAIFSQANGLLMIPVLGIWMYTQQGFSRAMKNWLVYSALVITLYIFCYWYGSIYQLTHDTNSLQLINILLLPVSFLATLGSLPFPQANITSLIISTASGALILHFAFQQIRIKAYPTSQLAILAFLFISILMLVATRGLIQGPGVAFVSRYKMYTAGFFVTAALLSPIILAKVSVIHHWRHGILALCIALYVSAYTLNIPQVRLIDGHLYQSLQYWVEDGDLRRAKGYFVRDADSYLFAALENNTWSAMVLIDPEQRLPAPAKLESCPAITPDLAEVRHVTMISHKNPNAAGIRVDPPRIQPDSAGTLMLCSDSSSYRVDVPAHTSTRAETFYYLPREGIQPGSYQVYWKDDREYLVQGSPFINKKNTR